MEEENKEVDSDEDAPEDIQQSKAREVAQERQKQEREVVKQLKETKKEKRRKRHEILIEQKDNKKAKLLSKLPDDILEILAAEDDKKGTVEDGKSEANGGDKPSEIASNVVKQLRSSKGGHENTKTKQRKKKKEAIPESSDEDLGDLEDETLDEQEENEKIIKACVLKQKFKPEESKAKVGRDFLREQLYGNRIKRVSSTSLKNSRVLDRGAKPKAKF